ncbi:MAG: hypothetical protein IKJ27_00225 [Clostridia bacterium]|nr:hypothetical protein [Clostridia bacterium]
MFQPSKSGVKAYSDTIMDFGGLNQRVRGNENEFYDMKNMSSDCYPLLSPRKRRVTAYITDKEITCLQNKEALIWCEIDENMSRLYVNGYEIEYFRSDNLTSERKIVSMGAYILLFPDGKYLNLLDYEDCGTLGNKNVIADLRPPSEGGTTNGIKIRLSTIDGQVLSVKTTSETAPMNPANGELWSDTSSESSVIKKWDSSTNQWLQLSSTYIKITKTGIGIGFKKWDTVTLSGFINPYLYLGDGNYTREGTERLASQLMILNSNGIILYDVQDDYIVVAGVLDKGCYLLEGSVTVERKVPDMDFVIECNNRLWGCKYGLVGGKVVNEIYACRQGDFKNWFAYLGISTDSYAVSLGSDGHFTGASVFNKCPVFFKENYIHQIYGSTPSSYQVHTTECEGVQRGQGDSVATCNNVLFYKGPTGFFAYTGALPQKISRCINIGQWEKVIGGGVGDKLYFACGAKDGEKSIYVYDTAFGIWHKEDCRNVRSFSRDGHLLYMLVKEEGKSRIESVTDEADTSLLGNVSSYENEDEVEWFAESVDIGYNDVNMKYVQKITVRAKLSEESEFRVYISCDGEAFKKVGFANNSEGVHTGEISFVPERCEYFRYRIVGTGDVKIISIKKTVIQGSDRS